MYWWVSCLFIYLFSQDQTNLTYVAQARFKHMTSSMQGLQVCSSLNTMCVLAFYFSLKQQLCVSNHYCSFSLNDHGTELKIILKSPSCKSPQKSLSFLYFNNYEPLDLKFHIDFLKIADVIVFVYTKSWFLLFLNKPTAKMRNNPHS